MKALSFLATTLLSVAVSAQQPPAPANAPAPAATEPRTSISAVEIADRIRQAEAAAQAGKQYQGGPLLQAGPFRAGLEYHTAPAPGFAAHLNDAELFVVLEGSGTLTMGGTLVNPKRNGTNLTAPTDEGGIPHKLVKGDMILVPENTPHAVTQVDGKLVLMSMHLPHPAPAPTTEPVGAAAR